MAEEAFRKWERAWSADEQAEIAELANVVREQRSLLKFLREKSGLTQEEFARLLQVSQSAVSKIEARESPQIDAIKTLVEAQGGDVCLLLRLPGRKGIEIPL